VQARLEPLEKNLLRDMIDNLLLIQRAKDVGINVDTALIRRLDELRVQNNIESMEDLERAIRAEGLGYEDFKSNIRNGLYRDEVMRREVGARAVPDKAEVQAYYDEHLQDFVRQESVYVREIFVSTEGKTEEEKVALRAKADGLLERVKAGEDFGKLAGEYSSDPGSKAQGGELGWATRQSFVQPFADALFTMQVGEIGGPVKTQFGYHVIQLDDVREVNFPPMAQVRPQIQQRLVRQKVEALVRELRAHAKVE